MGISGEYHGDMWGVAGMEIYLFTNHSGDILGIIGI